MTRAHFSVVQSFGRCVLGTGLVLAVAVTVAALLCAASALAFEFGPIQGPLPQRPCRSDAGGETLEQEPTLCERARWDTGGALSGTADELYYVKASTFGAISIADMARKNGPPPRRRERTWASVSDQPVVAPPPASSRQTTRCGSGSCSRPPPLPSSASTCRRCACIIAARPTTFWRTRVSRSTRWAPQRGRGDADRLRGERGDARSLPTEYAPLLMWHDVATDETNYITFSMADIGIVPFDMSGARIVMLESLASKNTVAYSVCGFATQDVTFETYYGPFTVPLSGPFLLGVKASTRTAETIYFAGLGATSLCNTHVRNGCANDRFSFVTTSYTLLDQQRILSGAICFTASTKMVCSWPLLI